MGNWLFYGIVGNSVCRTWESRTLAFPRAVNRVIHDFIACYPHFHAARGAYLMPGFSVLDLNPSFLFAGGEKG